MSVPTQITNHVAIALGKLIAQYADFKPVIHGTIKAHGNRNQDAEDALWQVIYLRMLHPAPGQTQAAGGAALDVLGSLVGCPRNGLADLDYTSAIDVQILVNISQGHPDDFLVVLNAVLGGPSAYTYTEQFYNSNFIEAYNLSAADAVVLLGALNQLRAGGYRAILRYSLTPKTGLFQWGDSSSGSATGGNLGFGDNGTGTPPVDGGLMASIQG